MVRSGCPWRYLPPSQTVYWYLTRWEGAGVTEKLLAALRVKARIAQGREPEPRRRRVNPAATSLSKSSTTMVARVLESNPMNQTESSGYQPLSRDAVKSAVGMPGTTGPSPPSAPRAASATSSRLAETSSPSSDAVKKLCRARKRPTPYPAAATTLYRGWAWLMANVLAP
jgi:hypothetical protein